MQEEEVDSSSYRNISMWVGNENIVIEGTKMSEFIVAYIVETDRRYRCLRCDYMSYDVVNTYTHIGYIHLGTYCTRCDTICFNSCPGAEDTNAPTSSESPLVVLSSFYSFLGNFHPRTAVERDLDYIIRVSERG